MKTIKDITSEHINKIYSIIIGKDKTAGRIEWTPEHDFVIARFKEEESVFKEYDTVEMGININDELQVFHVWDWKNKIGSAREHQPLYNHHAITKYLMAEGFDV